MILVNQTPLPAEWNNSLDCFVEGTTDQWVEHVLTEWKQWNLGDCEVPRTPVVRRDCAAKSGALIKTRKPNTLMHTCLPTFGQALLLDNYH